MNSAKMIELERGVCMRRMKSMYKIHKPSPEGEGLVGASLFNFNAIYYLDINFAKIIFITV